MASGKVLFFTMRELALRPEYATIHGSLPYDLPETSLGRGLREVLNFAKGNALVAETFDVTQTLDALKVSLRSEISKALAHAIEEERKDWRLDLRRESDWRSDTDTHPILSSLGISSPDDSVDVETLTVGEGYYTALDAQLEESMGSFDVLQSIRNDPQMCAHILPFIRQVAEHLQNSEHGIDEAFWYVREQTETNENLTLAPDSFSLLYLLTYLPRHLRFCVQQSLMSTSIRQNLAHRRSESGGTEVSQEFYRLLGEYYRFENQLHRHWQELVERYGASDDVFEVLNEDRIACLHVLHDLEILHQNSDLESHFDAHDEFLIGLSPAIEELDRQSECSTWQQTDTGHGFDLESYELSDLRRRNKVKEASAKDLGLACIFEDDGTQLLRYKEMIALSRYDLPDDISAASANAQDILAQAENPDVHFFLIDIEQEGDPHAGIRLGEAVVRRKAVQYSTSGKDRFTDAEMTRITIWTRSKQRRQEALQHFLRLKEELNTECSTVHQRKLISGINGSSSSSPIILEGKMKNEDPFS